MSVRAGGAVFPEIGGTPDVKMILKRDDVT
jgi:hypothetical protein